MLRGLSLAKTSRVDARRAPEWFGDGQLPDQASNVGADRRTAALGRDLRVQYHAKPRRCQATTVAGRTITKADFQSGQASRRPTQNSRSDQRTVGFERVRR